MYEIFEHTADLGLRVRAGTLSHLFEDSARGMFSMMVANLDDVRPVHERTYHLVGDQLDYLLFDWLSELLYTFESEQLLMSSFEIEVERGELRAVCRGEPKRARMDSKDDWPSCPFQFREHSIHLCDD